MVETIGGIFEESAVTKGKQTKYYDRVVHIVKKLSDEHFINEDPNSGNWMTSEDNILYLIDYDQVVQTYKFNSDVIYYYNLLKVKEFLFNVLDLHVDVVDTIKEVYRRLIKRLLTLNGKLLLIQ